MERTALRVLLTVGLLGSACHGHGSVWAAQEHARHHAACIFDHMTLRSAAGTCRPRARAYPAYVVGKVQQAIYDSALTFGIPFDVLVAIARCESALNPRASNGSHFGLFQFAPETFRRAANQLRSATGVVARSYWSPLDSSYVAGFMFVTGRALRWSCEPNFSH